MTDLLHKSDSRGLADHGWLLSRHTFSFADYYNPQRMNFGLLRVINDDIVKPSMGFGTHPHENMEIVSLPLAGSLRHQDSLGNRQLIAAGEVQVMSAGRGLTHSEYNHSDQEDVNFLQIWVYPKESDIPPRYGQQRFEREDRQNRFQTLVAPEKESGAVWINQQAWFSRADLDAGMVLDYHKRRAENGLYVFVIDGQLTIDKHELERRDGLGLIDGHQVAIHARSQADLLCIEVPME